MPLIERRIRTAPEFSIRGAPCRAELNRTIKARYSAWTASRVTSVRRRLATTMLYLDGQRRDFQDGVFRNTIITAFTADCRGAPNLCGRRIDSISTRIGINAHRNDPGDYGTKGAPGFRAAACTGEAIRNCSIATHVNEWRNR